jgi:cytolysin (calcineurin-like family phosphatase)
MISMKIFFGLLSVCLLPLTLLWSAPERNVTFISTSDSHYRESDHPLGTHNDLNLASIKEMNRLPELTWPDKLGGGIIGRPRGVLVLGDLIDDGDSSRTGYHSAEQWKLFTADFGLTGTDGLLKYWVFEGWGNHDGPPVGKEKAFSTQAELKKRTQIRLQQKQISNVSSNGLHYSWDWDDVHFVQLNLYPADKQNPTVHYSPIWHDPQGSLQFLKDDLRSKVGASGRPVVLMSHCGFDTDWWCSEDWDAVYQAAKNYNIVLYLYGHTGTGIKQFSPPGEAVKWDCINDGQTENGFFVIQITGTRIRAAMRLKEGLQRTRSTTGSSQHNWEGKWGWKWFLDKKITHERP